MRIEKIKPTKRQCINNFYCYRLLLKIFEKFTERQTNYSAFIFNMYRIESQYISGNANFFSNENPRAINFDARYIITQS